jgi:formylglycine-generating enzyme required for sulfatase activity
MDTNKALHGGSWLGGAWNPSVAYRDYFPPGLRGYIFGFRLAEDKSASGCRVLRGGSWCSDAEGLRSAFRIRFVEAGRDDNVGFRLVEDKP